MIGRPGRPTLLVIGGNETDRRMIARIAGGSFAVTEATNGERAISILSTQSFDAVVLDLTLPRLRGVDVLAYYHGRYPGRLNVIVTGRREQLAVIESDAAVHALIAKPFDVLSLAVRIRECARQEPVLIPAAPDGSSCAVRRP